MKFLEAVFWVWLVLMLISVAIVLVRAYFIHRDDNANVADPWGGDDHSWDGEDPAKDPYRRHHDGS